MQRLVIGIMIAIASATGLWGVAVAGERPLGTFKNWSTIRYQDNNDIVCMMWSIPSKQHGKYNRRGEPFVFVTRRNNASNGDRVSFEAGYNYRADSKLTVTIGTHKVMLDTLGSTAWIEDIHNNLRLVQWMRGGSTMIVEGVSSRGTKTTDIYSLLGVNAAHQAISNACG